MGREDYLIEFRCGGRSFAAEARGLRSIAGAHWRPATKASRRVVLAELLGLTAGPAGRTLVVARGQGNIGFVVESISKRQIERQAIRPVPELLQGWLRVPALAGLAYYAGGEGVMQVLDLPRLAEWVEAQAPEETGEKGQP
ncbi:MAG TPA: hypothetical protein PK668_00635 [Myxococcota bacterium]|nr:hypothetical protein [Myxococcota bacterium]HRY95662.1 hypothetical protein [Myxococcota bacterium]HSA21284.1 hypothetical protein [Myxococcota bacterium]